MKRLFVLISIIFLAAGWASPVFASTSSTPVVEAVFFFSPDWQNYQMVVTQALPPLRAKFGAQLEIGMLDITTTKGLLVYQAAMKQFNVPFNRQDAPTLIIGSTVMVGANEISAQAPDLVQKGIQAGGVPRPNIPGLDDALAVDATNYGQSTTGSTTDSNGFANGLAELILVVMLAVVGWEIFRQPWKKQHKSHSKNDWREALTWVIPTLVLVGLVVSSYLSYVELTATQAVCGPVGDCNAVQTSTYSRLFGILPIGILGILGNLSILAAWGFKRYGPRHYNHQAALVLVGLVSFGILFSIYLTFLEPFVIGATCAWCLASAVVMTGMFWTAMETAWK